MTFVKHSERGRVIDVVLPTLHPGQVEALLLPGRFKAIRCGRRWGKTTLGSTIACDDALKTRRVGIFAPDYKIVAETFAEIAAILDPVKMSSSKTEGVIRTRTGGRIDYWTLENERAGRSRAYHTVIIDEGAFTKPNMMDVWEKSIKPTLLDYGGRAFVLSNTNGNDPKNFLWRICNEPRHGFVSFHAPTRSNPHLPAAEIAKLREENHPLVYAQEYEAEFVDWSGVQFFDREKLLVLGEPVADDVRRDAVFAVIDTANKTGSEHDGTAVSYWGYSQTDRSLPLVCLDWDIVQIEGSLLEVWLPSVYRRLEELARATRARRGSLGAHIEDRQSGTILLQQAARHGWPARALDGVLTAAGKDGRSINVSGYVHRGMVKFSRNAYDRTSIFKGISRNHMLSQVLGYRVGQKDQGDDLLDTFTYAIAIALGNQGGH